MGVQTDIENRTSVLRKLLNDMNSAITSKGGNAVSNLSGISGAITDLPSGGLGSQVFEHNVTSNTPIQIPFSGGAGGVEAWGWGQLGTGFMANMYIFLGSSYATYIGETPATPMNVTIDASGVVKGLPEIDAGQLLFVRR